MDLHKIKYTRTTNPQDKNIYSWILWAKFSDRKDIVSHCLPRELHEVGRLVPVVMAVGWRHCVWYKADVSQRTKTVVTQRSPLCAMLTSLSFCHLKTGLTNADL